ncbi:MAG: SprT family zinc-dependent metalloprotease [Pelistega sp.]|nr:SprT family zinc-dependent metalloprotease [Pelistega sp.]
MQTSYHSVRTNAGLINYTFKRVRRASFSLKVGYDGVIVRTNLSDPISNAERYIRRFCTWIVNRLKEFEARRPIINQWELDKHILYLGKSIELKQHFANDLPLFMGDNNHPQDGDILLIDDKAHKLLGVSVQDSCEYWLKQQAYQWFKSRLEWFYQQTGRQPRAFRISKAMRSWGQCNSAGVIGLNWRLIHLPPEQIDYVIAHELAHLKHMNHSKAFWQEVGEIMPGYETAKAAIAKQSLVFLK